MSRQRALRKADGNMDLGKGGGKSRCFWECLVISLQVPQQSQLTEEYVSVT